MPYNFSFRSLKRFPKYGYFVDSDGLNMPDAHEQMIICTIHDMHYHQDISLPKIAVYLNAQGFRTRKGKEFQPNWMQRIAKQCQPHPEHWIKYLEAKKNG